MTASGRLADELRQIGRREGLDSVGICSASPFSDVRDTLEQRKRAGLSDQMQFTYRNPDRSTDPSRTVPGARSLFVGARRYLRVDDDCSRAAGRARVARYSWTDHYRPLRTALGAVAGRLAADGWRAAVVVDDNALVDRAAAVRAGLGWWGKNTNVLLPGLGSWFVLGSVITDAPIASKLPVAVDDGCGSCHRCIDDCPTGAIVEAGVLDARRCLAWLLQAPGVFPAEYRKALGDRIYGCDECQDVCPVNKLSTRRQPPPTAEDGSQIRLDVLELLGASDEDLEALVGRWYIPGREMRYVRRNALVVMANTCDGRDPGVESALRDHLRDPDGVVRAHAVWAAAALGRQDLLVGLQDDTDPTVRAELERPQDGCVAVGPHRDLDRERFDGDRLDRDRLDGDGDR